MSALLALAVYDLVTKFPRGLIVVASVLLAMIMAAASALRDGIVRALGFASSLVLIGVAAMAAFRAHPLTSALIMVCAVLALFAEGAAFRVRFALPIAPRPLRPVLLINPHSGGGKAARFRIAEEARARGIEPIEFGSGDELDRLARDALARGADALAMAGGDGSQAAVAAIAAEHHVPYACIPAGTYNHFALDLGVDREDVVGALDAFVDGKVRWVDLAEVNGRVFANNVSLGIYAEAVQRQEYRDAKLRTLLDVAKRPVSPAAVVVSNGAYRLGARMGMGTRPRLDQGLLGIVVLERREGDPGGMPALRESTAPEFVFDSTGVVRAGIDGEAATLQGPLSFRSRPHALQVRIARAHAGASPSASTPTKAIQVPSALVRIALGRP